MRFTKILLIVTACVSLAAPAARAEVFQWGDPELNLSITFPDDWRRVGNQQPDDVITVAAPGDYDYATCRVRVDLDRRFVIYPRDFADAVQRTNVSRKFWEDYSGQFAAAQINSVADNAGIGRGFASRADVSFVSPAGPKAQMRGIMYAAVYNDNLYVMECSAEREAFSKWYHPFLSAIKSFDQRPEYAQSVNGHYRDFQNDAKLRVHGGRKETDIYVY